MGQYYKFANIDKKEKCDRNRHGYKLMEHSYVGNNYCDDILRLLSDKWKVDRVIQVGDYAEPNDGTTTDKFITKTVKKFNINYSMYDFIDSFDEVSPNNNDSIRYVYNLDKKEYVDLYKQPIQNFFYDSKNHEIGACKINSFALLVGCGNQQGGGDYYHINKKAVGCWAGDKLVSSSVPINEYKSYKQKNLIFNEYKDKYKKIKKYHTLFENKILSEENEILEEYLKLLDKYESDLKKVKLDKETLLPKEIDSFNKVIDTYFENKKIKNKEGDLDANL